MDDLENVGSRYTVTSVALTLIFLPVAMLVIKWVDHDLFAIILGPYVTRYELVDFIPKLNRDVQEISRRYVAYMAEPYQIGRAHV